jgi:hypothetical protein
MQGKGVGAMMLFWKVRYLDRTDKQFKDRFLHLRTDTLDDAVTRAAVELIADNAWSNSSARRDILRFRHLFIEDTSETFAHDPRNWGGSFRFVGPAEYFEDDTGKEISYDEIVQITTGNPRARAFAPGTPQYWAEFALSEQRPLPLAGISLRPDELRLLAYFVRDFKELSESSFMRDGPGTLTSSGIMVSASRVSLETAVNDEEIRSFVTVFRRLYMENEPANFQKAVDVFVRALGDHPVAKLAAGIAISLRNRLDNAHKPELPQVTYTFTTKRLIDVFIYTQYAHQPTEQRQRQFTECLNEVGGERALLTWLFLTAIWKCGLDIGNAGRYIDYWFSCYCDHVGVSPDVLRSLRDDHTGLGVIEKQEVRSARLFDQKVAELAGELWNQQGRPEGGPDQFLVAAQEQLTKKLLPVAPA